MITEAIATRNAAGTWVCSLIGRGRIGFAHVRCWQWMADLLGACHDSVNVAK
jgi:hypothetical protein